MEDTLIIILTSVSFGLVGWGMYRRDRLYQSPTLIGAVLCGWLLPQALPLRNDISLPDGAFVSTLVMAILAGVAFWAGARRARPVRLWQWRFRDRDLLVIAAGLSLVGAFFHWMISRLPPEMLINAWTGLPTLYLFFAINLSYGFALAAMVFVRNRSLVALVICLFGLAFYAWLIVLGGRRSVIVEFGMIVLLTLWFTYRWAPPRVLVAAAMVAGAIVIWSIGDYRAITGGQYGEESNRLPTIEEVMEIDWLGNLQAVATQKGRSSELRNAVYDIAAVKQTQDYTYGASYWNFFVFRYVPKQLLGADVKDALMFDDPNRVEELYYYKGIVGETRTGLSNSFTSFWYFGALVFFLIGRIMGSLWVAADRGNLVAQLAYMLMAVHAMQSITHDTGLFFTPWLHMAAFLIFPLSLVKFKVRFPVRRRPAVPLRERPINPVRPVTMGARP